MFIFFTELHLDYHEKWVPIRSILAKTSPCTSLSYARSEWHEQQRVAINSTTQNASGNLSEIMFFKTHCLVPRKGTDCAASVLGGYGTNKSLPFLLHTGRI